MAIKQERLEQIIRKEVSEIIQFKIKDPNISFVTVTDVEVTRDYSIATIYITFFNREIGDDVQLQALNRAKGFIRSELGSTLTVRKVPELIFKIDDSLDKGNRIDQLLKGL